MAEDSSISINEFIAATGLCSRREADKLLDVSRVMLNDSAKTTDLQVYDFIRSGHLKVNKADHFKVRYGNFERRSFSGELNLSLVVLSSKGNQNELQK